MQESHETNGKYGQGSAKEYIADVKTSKFLADEHVYHIQDSIEDFNNLFDEFE